MVFSSCSAIGSILFLCTIRTEAFSTDSVNNNIHKLSRNIGHILRRNAVKTVLASTKSSDVDFLPEIRNEIIEREGQLQSWEESVQIISDLFKEDESLEESEAELYLADAFRWKAWASATEMTRKYQRPVLPNADKLQEGLNWLRDGPLEMTDEMIRNNIRQYPGIYLREPNAFYKKVLGSAPRKYRKDEGERRSNWLSEIDCIFVYFITTCLHLPF